MRKPSGVSARTRSTPTAGRPVARAAFCLSLGWLGPLGVCALGVATGCGSGSSSAHAPSPLAGDAGRGEDGAAGAPERGGAGGQAGPLGGAGGEGADAPARGEDAAAHDAPPAEDLGGAVPDASGADLPADAAGIHLESAGFLVAGMDLVFPKSASFPVDMSPPFTFVGVPAAARSLAFVFVDRDASATKWVIWDIPPGTTGLPANLSKTPHPGELPTSMQRGSLGRTGYSGPGVTSFHSYDFTLYALDVDKLPGTETASTAEIRTQILTTHTIAKSPPFVARGKAGGP